MHILFLSHYFPPEVNAPASRTYENAKRWVAAGHKVTVLTCAPNHPDGVVYSGYRNKLYQWDQIDDIRVLRVKTYIAANKGFVPRILNYVSYLFSATLFCRLVDRPDLVVSTSPQFFCGLAGFTVSRLKRSRWLLEIRDLWPESIVAVEAIPRGRVIRLLEKVETFMYRRADHIVSVTRSFLTHIHGRQVPMEKMSVVTNGADLERYKPCDKDRDLEDELGLTGKFVISYIGTHGMAHSLDTVLSAADQLRDNRDIVFLLVGDGAERDSLLEQKKQMRLDNVVMLPQQPKEMVPRLLSLTDVAMVLLKKSDLFKTVIPSKMFEAMAMSRPLIFGVEGESRDIFLRGDCGIAIEPENATELAVAAENLAADRALTERLGKNGRMFVSDHYDRDVLAARYLEILNAVSRGNQVSEDCRQVFSINE